MPSEVVIHHQFYKASRRLCTEKEVIFVNKNIISKEHGSEYFQPRRSHVHNFACP
ncbi:uncharacterized protein PGTG_02509 [Puccinia graminis f. sp. tritici CRL 75-36-700-3]|uniref:Uncharacterized protein n=1 Tax=Puccinia graminis f. sp. tritici (strain CRL 75-36-700-3 / race SCCL) TaxID=418459 RepID=E3JVJ3_PUCGT|nr:uncharacterized protein PGTG_02509 [Puccinia graminis f. sp. tritici CRL 75-36-700-3]EFP76068.2 hypothetical protein PGTG_02509 [Puccinia graminis f. sp. tritici CRL 75-36-700-3]